MKSLRLVRRSADSFPTARERAQRGEEVKRK